LLGPVEWKGENILESIDGVYWYSSGSGEDTISGIAFVTEKKAISFVRKPNDLLPFLPIETNTLSDEDVTALAYLVVGISLEERAISQHLAKVDVGERNNSRLSNLGCSIPGRLTDLPEVEKGERNKLASMIDQYPVISRHQGTVDVRVLCYFQSQEGSLQDVHVRWMDKQRISTEFKRTGWKVLDGHLETDSGDYIKR
jgi:hypothetical protein